MTMKKISIQPSFYQNKLMANNLLTSDNNYNLILISPI